MPCLRAVPGQALGRLFFAETVGNIPVERLIWDIFQAETAHWEVQRKLLYVNEGVMGETFGLHVQTEAQLTEIISSSESLLYFDMMTFWQAQNVLN